MVGPGWVGPSPDVVLVVPLPGQIFHQAGIISSWLSGRRRHQGSNLFDLALFLTFGGCCRGIGRKSPGRKNNVSPSWHKIVESARSSLSNVESVQDVGVTPCEILRGGLQFSFVKKKHFCLSINCGTCSPVFLSICSSILPPS